MAKPNKAQIKFKNSEGTETVLRFHAVIAEEHDASSTLTKFPVQTGFEISNHVIIMNRKVGIEGMVTNNVIVGAEEFHMYGGDNVRIMFDTLTNLIRQAVPCEVQTNYGSYSPVIFTGYKTKLVAGMTDSMSFKLTGEEVQLATTVGQDAPVLLNFTPLTEDQRLARVAELREAGIDVPDDAIVSQTQVDLNSSFQVETSNPSGELGITTYKLDSYDAPSGVYGYEVHTSDTKVASKKVDKSVNWYALLEEESRLGLPDIGLSKGAETTSACLQEALSNIATSASLDYIDTALGSLRRSVYGAIFSKLGLNDISPFGQMLLNAGVDCLVAGAVGATSDRIGPEDFTGGLPSTDSIIRGATDVGDRTVVGALRRTAPTTLTKITRKSGTPKFFGDLL